MDSNNIQIDEVLVKLWGREKDLSTSPCIVSSFVPVLVYFFVQLFSFSLPKRSIRLEKSMQNLTSAWNNDKSSFLNYLKPNYFKPLGDLAISFLNNIRVWSYLVDHDSQPRIEDEKRLSLPTTSSPISLIFSEIPKISLIAGLVVSRKSVPIFKRVQLQTNSSYEWLSEIGGYAILKTIHLPVSWL